MKARWLILIGLVTSLNSLQAATYTQRCMKESDMEGAVKRIQAEILSMSPAKSVRNSVDVNADSVNVKSEFFLDKDCTRPYLTSEKKYKDVVVDGILAHHRYMGLTVTCQSELAVEKWAHWGEFWEDSRFHSWDGNVFTEDLTAQAESEQINYRVRGEAVGTGLKVRVESTRGLIPLYNDLEDDAFKLSPGAE